MHLLKWIRNRFHPLWHIRRTPWLFAILRKFDFPVWKQCQTLSHPMKVMWFRDMSWLFDSLPKEPQLNSLILELCDTFQPEVFWDVGANLGWFTWLINSRTPLKEAVLFEPLPRNADLLRETIKRGGLRHVILREAAVSDRCGEVSFLVDEQSGATSQISEIFATSGTSSIAHTYGINKEIRVRTVTLDGEITRGAAVPDLIKMDIEEAEVLALRGAANLVTLEKTIIVFECHRKEAIGMLQDRKWSVFVIDDCNNYLAIPPMLMNRAEKIVSKLEKV